MGKGEPMTINWKTCFRAGVTVFVLYLCMTFWPSALELLGTLLGAASPMLIGCVIAYLVNILMKQYEQHWFAHAAPGSLPARCRRPMCMVLSFATLILVVVLVLMLVVPELASCVRELFAALPGLLQDLADTLDGLGIFSYDLSALAESLDLEKQLAKMLEALVSGVSGVLEPLAGALSSVFSGVVSLAVGVVFSLYLLAGKERLAGQCNRLMQRWMNRNVYRKVCYVLEVLNDSFSRYIVGQCVEAVILGTLCTVGMLILRLPYASMIGVLIAFTALIPVAGAYIGGGVGALLICSQSPVQAVIFLVYLVILQQLEGNLIYPRVVGSSLGLPAIWVLAAVTIGGGLLGIGGMLLGVPLAAALYRLLKEDLRSHPVPAADAPQGEPGGEAP